MTWRERLKELLDILCRIYTGLQCDSVPGDVAEVYGQYQDEGCTPLQGSEGQTALSSLQSLLAESGNDLSEADNIKLNEIIASCLASP